MKIISIFVICFFCLASGNGQGIIFEKDSWASVLAKAKQEKKIVFIDCVTVWCKPCKWMAANVFPENRVGGFYNEKFINVRMDMETEEGIELRKKYNVNAYPTYLFVDSEGNLLHRDGGAKNAGAFIAIGEKALNPASNLDGMSAQYEAGNRSQEFLREYIPVLGKAKQKEKQKQIFEDYFSSSDKNNLFNEKDLGAILSVANPGDTAFNFVLANREKYIALIGRKRFDSLIYRKHIAFFSKASIRNDIKKIKETAAKLQSYYPEIVQKAADMITIRYYRRKQITDSLIQSVALYIKNYKIKNTSDLVYLTNYILDAPSVNSGKYKMICSLIQSTYKSSLNDYVLADVYAGLLYKSGKKKKAKKIASLVMENIPKNNWAKLWSTKMVKLK